MTGIALLLVILSGFMNAVWNFGAKRSKHKGVFIACMMLLSIVVFTPGLVMEWLHSDWKGTAYILIALTILVQCAYSYLLSRAYRFGDLSQVHPIMRGTGVILIPILGVTLLGESLAMPGWLGVVCIAFGILSMSQGSRQSSDFRNRYKPVAYSVLVGGCITAYTLIDKLTLAYLSPLAVMQCSNIGFFLVQAPQLWKWQLVQEEWRLNWRLILIGSLFVPGSYLLFLYAMDMGPVSQLAPAREIGTVFSALIGVWILKETQGRRRIVASIIIVAGIMMIGFSDS